MQKKILFSLLLVLGLATIIAVAFSYWSSSVIANNVQIHKRDLQEQGLIIINAADTSFDNDVNEWLQDKRDTFQSIAKTLKPFSFFIKNTTNKDLIAYRLKWELTNSDGTVTNYSRNYFEPNPLMGVRASNKMGYAYRKRRSVEKNSKRFFTIIPSPFEDNDQSGNDMIATKLEKEEVDKFQEAAIKGDISPFIAKLNEQLHQAVDVTVSIDGALFDDGSFVGRDSDDYFVHLKGYVAAKHDLLQMMLLSVRNKMPTKDLFEGINTIATQPVKFPTGSAEFSDFYNYFRKIHAEEVMSVRQALGDDSKTISSCLSPLRNEWHIPHDINKPENKR